MDLLDDVREITPHQAITTDSGYGVNGDFLKALRERKEPYVVAITPSDITIVPELGLDDYEGRKREGQRRTNLPIGLCLIHRTVGSSTCAII